MATYTTTIVSSGSPKPGSVRCRQIGTLLDSAFTQNFASALANAASAATGVTFDGVDKLSFTSSFTGSLSIIRTTVSPPATGDTHGVQFFAPSNGIVVPKATVAAVAGSPALPSLPAYTKGINISGMEFSGFAFFPSNDVIDYYYNQGFRSVRLPGLWQRMQPLLYGALDTNGSNGYADKYRSVVNYVIGKGMVCIVDSAHNYGARPEGSVGSAAVPVDAFDDYCQKLFLFIGGSDLIIYDLMNEPPSNGWVAKAQSHVAAFRAAGAKNRIHVAYTDEILSTAIDPLNNVVFDVHKYLDTTFTGTTGECVVGSGSTRLSSYVTAANAAGKKLHLGEFAGGYPTVQGQEQCAIELPALIDVAQTAGGPWTGWAAWGAGRNWTQSYPFRLEYDPPGVDTPYLTILKSKL